MTASRGGDGGTDRLKRELREQGRGVVGALLVAGTAMLFTVEMWWHGWQLRTHTLVVYDVVGLAGILAVTRVVGFREAEAERTQPSVRRNVTDFSELIAQSFVTAYGSLLLFGVVEWGDSLLSVARLGLVYVVPLGFGAALANELLHGADQGREETGFPNYLATFALGSVFFVAPIAPTQEIAILAATTGWERLAVLVVVTLVVSYLVLFELEFRGQRQRVGDRGPGRRVGQVFVVYALGAVISVGLLASFGQFAGASLPVAVQKVVVLAFPAAIGASAARVVLA